MAALFHRFRHPEGLKELLAVANAASKQKIVIDYSSPNIAKQFHIGNLRSTILGNYIRNINNSLGNTAIGVNYLGDWGVQFAMIASYWPEVKPSEGFWNQSSDVDKIKMLTGCYVVANNKAKLEEDFRMKVREVYQDMEKQIMNSETDSPILQLWRDVGDISRKHLMEFYKLLHLEFDSWLCESAYIKKSSVLVDKLISDGIARKTDDGLWVIDYDGQKYKTDNKYAIIRKSDETTLYLSREIAAIMARDEMYNADKYLYVVDRAQRTHFIALKAVLERMGCHELAEKVVHVPYGRVKGLSTRLGKTEAVFDIIQKGSELALDFINESKTIKVNDEAEKEKTAQELAISTILFNDLKRAKSSEYQFSFQNAFTLNQTNALLLQMKHSRLHSIEERNKHLLPLLESCQTLPEGGNEVQALVELLTKFEQVLTESNDKLEPCHLAVYLIQLSNAIGTCMNQLPVKDQPTEIAVPRLFLFSTARAVLGEGMKLLGIEPVDKM
ncbi:unnamed protein product [Auanema sp. JU1783]|nr:unnamed protein product [Auanema sp. JU1783]